ncbi:MAG TPA: histidine kinase [Opitutaceae bacterium]|nr:histidine kinase [Opitutaceae bacterium]
MALETRAANSENLPVSPGISLARQEAIEDVLSAEDVEQAYLARMLHDNVGQNVAALLLGFKGLERELINRPDARLTLQSLHAITQNIGQELHKIALELRPSALDDHGLVRALAAFLDEWSLIEKVRVEFDCMPIPEWRVPRRTQAVLFRVVRHALHYIAKPVHAAQLSVILQHGDEGVTAVIENTGDRLAGNGSEGLTAKWHLDAIKARLSLVGGTVAVETRPPHGMALFVRVPLAIGDPS